MTERLALEKISSAELKWKAGEHALTQALAFIDMLQITAREALSLPERKEGDSIQAPSRAQSANASAVNQAFPIKTAPMDGTHFIGIDGKNGWWREMWWKVDYYDGAYWMDECDSEPDPSHWVPLPIFDSSLNAERPTGQTESALEANTTSPPAQAAADADVREWLGEQIKLQAAIVAGTQREAFNAFDKNLMFEKGRMDGLRAVEAFLNGDWNGNGN